jgi:hypothetical protein
VLKPRNTIDENDARRNRCSLGSSLGAALYQPRKLLHLPDKPAGVVVGDATIVAVKLALLPDKPAGGDCG